MATREVTEQETVAGQMKGLLETESPYTTMARTKASEAAQSKGLLNSSMAVQAGEAAAIESVLPIAQQDAETYASSGQSAQESGQTILETGEEYGQMGALSAQESAQSTAQTSAEYTEKGILSTQEAGQDQTLSAQESTQRQTEDVVKGDITEQLAEQSAQIELGRLAEESRLTTERLIEEYSLKGGLSAQESDQTIGMMISEYALKEGLTEAEAALEINRMNEEYSLEEFKAVEDDLRAQQMARLETDYQKEIDYQQSAWDYEIRWMMEQNSYNIAVFEELGATSRAELSAATDTYLAELGVSSDERMATINAVDEAGQQLTIAIASISTSDLDSTGKADSLNNALAAYYATTSTAASIAGIDVTWADMTFGVSATTDEDGNTTGGDYTVSTSESVDDAAYYAAKAAQLNSMEGGFENLGYDSVWTAAEVEAYFAEVGTTPQAHYDTYGANEGLDLTTTTTTTTTDAAGNVVDPDNVVDYSQPGGGIYNP